MMADSVASIPFLRPLSAKKKAWCQPFSPVVSCSRLRRVQSLLKCCSNPQAKTNGILCILGIDSRYNGGARRLLNYLLFGFCELTPADVSNTQISDEELEDVVIFVKAESVHVYCNPVNYSFLLPLIAHWRNLHIHCLSEEEYRDNEEKAEDFKIVSFISMVKGSECIGIPYSDGTVGEKQPTFEPFALEKWPLVQAYALEGFSSGGFFTMNHEVLNVSEDLHLVYGLLDPVGIETLVTQILPLFEHHCNSVLINVDLKNSNMLSRLTERSLSEPIVSYFNHGHISETSNAKSSSANYQPYVLLGCNSSRKQLKNLERLSSNNSNSTLTNSGINGSPAKHLVCFASEPKGVITCARTYFLENCYIPYSLQEAEKESPCVSSNDVRLLMDLYLLSIHAVVEAIKTFSQTFSQKQSKSTVLSRLNLGIQEKKIELDPCFLSSNVEFTIEACDYLGRNVALEEGKPLGVIKKVCLYIYDVPSMEHPGETLGSIIFGESFQDSGIRTLIPDSPSVWNSSFVCLTENIPRFVSWLGSGEEEQASTELYTFAKSKTEENWLGRQLLFGNEVFILSSVNGWEEGSFFIYEQGFLLIHPRTGCVLLPMAKLMKVLFYDGDSTSMTGLLMLTCYSSLQRNLPCHFLTENNTVVLALTRRSRVYTMFYSDVLHLWKGKQLPNMPPFKVVTDLPDRLLRMHVLLHQQLKQSSKRDIYSLSSAEAFLPSLKGFLSHFAVSSSLGDIPVKSEDLPVLLGNNLLEQGQPQDFELLLTILTGLPGSGKEALCLTLVDLAKEDSKWMVLQRPVDQAELFDPKVLQKSLTNILTSQRRLHARISANRRLRVVIVTPGFTDVIDVIQAITLHPDLEVAKSLKIAAVTCCIDPLNTFMENRLTLPKLLEQCAQGWVNNVVFTSCLEPQNEQLSLTQNLVRASNPDVACILAKDGEVTRTPDVELILSDSAFNESKTVQRRHLMCPGWSLGLFSSGSSEPPITEIRVSFYGPLDRHRFISNLKEMQGPISGIGMVKSGAIHSLQGHICFSEGNTQREVHIHWARLSGALKITTVDSSAVPRPPPSKAHSNGTVEDVPQYFIVFTGFHLQEQNLKDWLTTCCKPAPAKQKFKLQKDLSDKEIKDISYKHKFDPLPPGWFYNGSHYVSLTGDKDSNHPLLETFIEAYLHGINEDIKQHNIIVDSQPPVMNIFEPRSSS